MATPRPTCDMNMTPMIDVLLVLLVIFMAAMPLTQKGLDVQLPMTVAPPEVPQHDSRIVIELDAAPGGNQSRSCFNGAATAASSTRSSAGRRDKTLFISAARTLRYGDVVTVIDAAKGAGVERVGIITDAMRAKS